MVALCTDDDILTEVILGVYIYPENPWILETPSSLKPLLTRGNLYPLRLWIFSSLVPLPSIPWNSEALESLRPKLDLWSRWVTEAEIVGGSPLSLKLLSPCIFGSLESLRPKLDLWSPWNVEAENVIMMGHPEAWEAAWGVVRLLGVVQRLGDLETS